MAYSHKTVEAKWQKYWDEKQVFKTVLDPSKPKYYVLDMFPYPSGSGLHVGHPEGYTATDILARYKRTKGFNVLHPMGWDAFGLPAEQHAIQTGTHPSITTNQAIENFRRQLKMLGFSYDWSREISTCAPNYYRWTQWIFKRLYDRGLAYQKEVPVNWCPALKTVLANEEVVDGKSERGGHPVFRQPMRQWMLKITDYADRLLRDLDQLDWPEGTKELQRNWIGRSEGLQMRFPVTEPAEEIEVFTTRPDTIFGATYLVLAPEHPLVAKITTNAQRPAIEHYVKAASSKSEIARQEQAKEKTGVFTGAYSVNPVNDERIPIWVADYVMMGYGTGAIMAVPAHDERDYDFAKAFDLPIREVVVPIGEKEKETRPTSTHCFGGEGKSVHSGFISELPTKEAKERIIHWAETNGRGTRRVNFKLRDWLFSRQRYWGEPFPIVHLEDGSKEALADDLLPVVLPAVKSYEPSGTGESPLAAITDWLVTTDPKTGRKLRRETDTMPGSAGSSWYFLRYCDPTNEKEAWSKEAEKYWMPVDLYIGGPEHAVGHLLYARFWTKVLFDAGLVTHDEPFQKLVHQGMILGEDGEKMSKSRGNVINPDDVVREYGADTLRLYEMFMGPLEQDKPWSTSAISGTFRFLQRSWRIFMEEKEGSDDVLVVKDDAATEEDLRITHKTIQKVTEDIENLRFNTAISQMMVFVNHFTAAKNGNEARRPRSCLKPFVQLLHPFAPHMAEELWAKLGEKEMLAYAKWPVFDPAYVKDDTITVAIQVLGKTRGTVEVPADADQATVEKAALQIPQVMAQIEGKTVKKVIFVRGKILNFVVA